MSEKCPVYINPSESAVSDEQILGFVPLAQFHRVLDMVEDSCHHNDLQFDLHFYRSADGNEWVKGRISGQVIMSCQRCLGEMEIGLDIRLDHLFCDDEKCLKENKDKDTILYQRGAAQRLVDLFEDEVILSLPLIAKHPQLSECGEIGDYLLDSSEEVEKTEVEADNNPFSILKDRFK